MTKAFPHEHVYARIAPSEIHGVGVVAILSIKKGTCIFVDDTSKMIWIHKDKLPKLPKALERLYKDFAVLKNGRLGCPNSFNSLTPAWYLNHSDKPNVGCDPNYNFYALRNIKIGEELTVDYNSYSEE